MPDKPVYLDYAASTPLDEEVAAVMAEAAKLVGNPSATHFFGRELRRVIDGARREVAEWLDVAEDGVVFTSGATEANNLALLGRWRALAEEARHGARVLVNPLEHPSVLAAVAEMEKDGASIDWLPVDAASAAAVAAPELIRPETVLVACQWVNNVFGTIQPVKEMAAAVAAERERRGPTGRPLAFHVDAVQAARFLEMRPAAWGIDSLAVSGHKLYGPKGVGALWCRQSRELAPLIVGGGQEGGRRSGTENVAGIAGLGRAARLAGERRFKEWEHAAGLRTALIAGVRDLTKDFSVVGERVPAVPGILALRSASVRGDLLALRLDEAGVAVSTGSACEAGKREPARALKTVLGPAAARHGLIRVSFGRRSSNEEIRELVAALAD